MPSTRTQIYLTAAQRDGIDTVVRREGKSLAWVIREALDQYLAGSPRDLRAALDGTFGAIPDLTVPSRDEWDRFPPESKPQAAPSRTRKRTARARRTG